MRDMKTRLFLLSIMIACLLLSAAGVFADNTPVAVWPNYHYDSARGGQNANSTDITDPGNIGLVWAFPRVDSGSDNLTEADLRVDDQNEDGLFTTTNSSEWKYGDDDTAWDLKYHYASSTSVGDTAPTATWQIPGNLPNGMYKIYIWLPTGVEGATEVKYTVTDDDGTHEVTFDQSDQDSSSWRLLSDDIYTYTLNTSDATNKGISLSTVTTNTKDPDTGDIVIADAVMFYPVTGMEIYSSPVSAELYTTIKDPDDSSKTLWTGMAPHVFVGTVEVNQKVDDSDFGAVYCINSVTPTLQDPNTMTDSTEKEKYLDIAKSLGTTRWRYPRSGDDVNSRDQIEGPIEGGIYSSPALAYYVAPDDSTKMMCIVTAMDRQVYALDAETGELLWKGPGYTASESTPGWTEVNSREDAFGGSFHYAQCVASGESSCTWNFDPIQQGYVTPSTVSGAGGLSYAVYAWLPNPGGTGDLSRSTDAVYTITYNSGSDTKEIHINQSDNSASYESGEVVNAGRWVQLGSSYFNPTMVTLTNRSSATDPGSYAVVADAVMFVPDTIDSFGYCSPITNSNPESGINLATKVFAVSANGRAMSFDIKTSSNSYKIGRLEWIYPQVHTKANPEADEMDKTSMGTIIASPTYNNMSNPSIFIASGNGVLRRLSTTGSLIWPTTEPVATTPDEIDAGYSSSPAIDTKHDLLYIGDESGVFHCVSAINGADIWKYPGDDDTSPLQAFRYSTPAIGYFNNASYPRIYAAGDGGKIYSFDGNPTPPDSVHRIYMEYDSDNELVTEHGSVAYYEPSLGESLRGSIAIDGKLGDKVPVMYIGDMGDSTDLTDPVNKGGTLHWRDAINGTTDSWTYKGRELDSPLFSSPNLTHTEVDSTKVSWLFIGCADGRVYAFSREGGAWGGTWQGGMWPAGVPTENEGKITAAPETNIQVDVFKESVISKSTSYNPEPKSGDNYLMPSSWPSGSDTILINQQMKQPNITGLSGNKLPDIWESMATVAQSCRNTDKLVVDRTSNTLFFEWGEKICLGIWNLPGLDFLYGSNISEKQSNIKITLTNASVGSSAGTSSTIASSIVVLKQYTLLSKTADSSYTANLSGYSGAYLPITDSDGKNVKACYAVATIDLSPSSSNSQLLTPGPGWILKVNIKKKTSDSTTSSSITQVDIPVAILKKNSLTPVLIGTSDGNKEYEEQPIGINNPLAIKDDPSSTSKTIYIAWGKNNDGETPNRDDEEAHFNGNAIWSSSSSSSGYKYKSGPTPIINLGSVNHGTSSRVGRLGVMDRSAVGIRNQNLPKFRIDTGDLIWRGGDNAIVCPSGTIGINYGIKMPWEQGANSADYPDIARRHESFLLLSKDLDPTKSGSDTRLLHCDPTTVPATYDKSELQPDAVTTSVDVPKFQPANMYGYNSSYSTVLGYSRRMIAYIDSDGDEKFDSGTVSLNRPSTKQEAYRRFRVGLAVPPDPEIEVDDQLIDIGRVPHGLGIDMSDFSAYNPASNVQQWFKTVTIKNAGNVNLQNIKFDNTVSMYNDQSGSFIPMNNALTSSFDIQSSYSLPWYASEPFTTFKDGTFLGYTLSKPRVGDPDPTIMTIPDQRKYNTSTIAQTSSKELLVANGWDSDSVATPLKPEISIKVPLSQPVGTYHSYNSTQSVPYVAAYADINNNGKWDSGEPVSMPSFQLKVSVRENQITGGATPTTLPQIDYTSPDGVNAVADSATLPKWGDSTPAAFRDAKTSNVYLFWSSNRLTDPDNKPNWDDITDPAIKKFSSAPWFIDHATLRFDGTWVPTDAPMHWWDSPVTIMPQDQWATPVPSSVMKWPDDTGSLRSVRHFSPVIGINIDESPDATEKRDWLAWAGTADTLDSTTNKVSQNHLIFYTDATGGVDSTEKKVYSIEHDLSMVKRSPSLSVYKQYVRTVGGSSSSYDIKNRAWMFWQGGGKGQWSIYYSTNSTNNLDPDKWSNDMKLRTPDCLASVGAPNAIRRYFWADLQKTDSGGAAEHVDYYNKAKGLLDIVYSGTTKLTQNSDILLTRYLAEPPDRVSTSTTLSATQEKVQPSQTAQPLPRVYNEKLARDPKYGFYTSQHLAWLKLDGNSLDNGTQKPDKDHWGEYYDDSSVDKAYIHPNVPYIQIVFPDGYTTSSGETLEANTVISATDGSAIAADGSIIEDPATYGTSPNQHDGIIPEIDSATNIYTYKYPSGSLAEEVLGQTMIDYSSGIVRFTKPLKEERDITGKTKSKFKVPEVYADYTPMTWRLTTDSAADSSPRAFIEYTKMNPTTNPGVCDAIGSSDYSDPRMSVDRLWVFWRKAGTAVDSSTIFYKTYRVGVDLAKLDLPAIPWMYNSSTAAWEISPSAKLTISGNLGPWEVDKTGKKIYFSQVDERYQSLLTSDNKAVLLDNQTPSVYTSESLNPITLSYTSSAGDSITQKLYDISWMEELPEQSLFGYSSDANVNEGSIYAFADPNPLNSGTYSGDSSSKIYVSPSKIWVFWVSTRAGNSDLFWETINPDFGSK